MVDESKRTIMTCKCDDKLWSMQFDRWWGWNWLRRQEDWMKNKLLSNKLIEQINQDVQLYYYQDHPKNVSQKKKNSRWKKHSNRQDPATLYPYNVPIGNDHHPVPYYYYPDNKAPPPISYYYDDNMTETRPKHLHESRCCGVKTRKIPAEDRKTLQNNYVTPCVSHEYLFATSLFASRRQESKCHKKKKKKKRKSHKCSCSSSTTTTATSSSSYACSKHSCRNKSKYSRCCCCCCCSNFNPANNNEQIETVQVIEKCNNMCEEGVQTFAQTIDRFTQTFNVEQTDRGTDNIIKKNKSKKDKRHKHSTSSRCCCCCCCCCCKPDCNGNKTTKNKINAYQQYEEQISMNHNHDDDDDDRDKERRRYSEDEAKRMPEEERPTGSAVEQEKEKRKDSMQIQRNSLEEKPRNNSLEEKARNFKGKRRKNTEDESRETSENEPKKSGEYENKARKSHEDEPTKNVEKRTRNNNEDMRGRSNEDKLMMNKQDKLNYSDQFKSGHRENHKMKTRNYEETEEPKDQSATNRPDCRGLRCLCCDRCLKRNIEQNDKLPTRTFAAQHYNLGLPESRHIDADNVTTRLRQSHENTLKLINYNAKLREDDEHRNLMNSILNTIVNHRNRQMEKTFPEFKIDVINDSIYNKSGVSSIGGLSNCDYDDGNNKKFTLIGDIAKKTNKIENNKLKNTFTSSDNNRRNVKNETIVDDLVNVSEEQDDDDDDGKVAKDIIKNVIRTLPSAVDKVKYWNAIFGEEVNNNLVNRNETVTENYYCFTNEEDDDSDSVIDLRHLS